MSISGQMDEQVVVNNTQWSVIQKEVLTPTTTENLKEARCRRPYTM